MHHFFTNTSQKRCKIFAECLTILFRQPLLLCNVYFKKDNVSVLHCFNSCFFAFISTLMICKILLPVQEVRKFILQPVQEMPGFGFFVFQEQRITFPPSAISFLIVGSAATIRFSSVIFPSISGTLKSHLARTSFPFSINIIYRFLLVLP